MWLSRFNHTRLKKMNIESKWIVGDFHIHSKFSKDSVQRPSTIFKLAQQRGLNCISITDHNSFEANSSDYNERGMIWVKGVEIKTEIGDIIGLFIEEPIKSDRFQTVTEEIKDQGGLVVLPHPFSHHKIKIGEIVEQVDLIEIFNGRCTKRQNERAKKLAMRLNKPMIGGSDAHFPWKIASVKTIFRIPSFTRVGLKEGLLRSKKYFSIRNHLPLFSHICSIFCEKTKILLNIAKCCSDSPKTLT
ncbi:MAG: PHP domain-containing protein [Candidatus Lokiarchaeota archaeon]|nr:PHP domain-containing protein [Candidatus Lokiarchaeota archaeon]